MSHDELKLIINQLYLECIFQNLKMNSVESTTNVTLKNNHTETQNLQRST